MNVALHLFGSGSSHLISIAIGIVINGFAVAAVSDKTATTGTV